MKRIVVSLLLWILSVPSTALADEFKLFGVGLTTFEDHTAAKYEKSAQTNRDNGFRQLAGTTDLEQIVLRDLGAGLPAYDYSEERTATELQLRRAYENVLKSFKSNADDDVWSKRELSELNSQEIDAASREFEQFLNHGLGSIHSCFITDETEVVCPDHYEMNEDIFELRFVGLPETASETPIPSSGLFRALQNVMKNKQPTLRVTQIAFLMDKRVDPEVFLTGLQGKYPHVDCDRNFVNGQFWGHVCKGEREWIVVSPQGDKFQLMLAPGLMQSVLRPKVVTYQQEAIDRFETLSAKANAYATQKAQSDVNEIFGTD